MDKVRLGLIGLGYIGRFHLQNCLKLDSAKLVAVSDISKKALKIAKNKGIKKTYLDYHDLLNDKSIDAVIIALPTHFHLPCAKNAAEAGKHILLEKPLALNVAEGNELISATAQNNVKLMVGYPYRFCSSFKALKEKIEQSEPGEIQVAYATMISSGPFFHRDQEGIPRPVPEWWFNKELTGGGVLMDLGSHLINLTRWFFGEMKDIKTYLGYRFNLDFEDHSICIVNFKSGTTALINTGWFSRESVLKMELFGTVSHAQAKHSQSNKILTAAQLILKQTPKFFKPHFEEVQHFVQCIRDDARPSPSGEDALKDLEAISRAYKNQIHLD